MQRLTGLRFLYVTGKGGVGKSTVAAALGARLAEDGQRVLVTFGAGAVGQERLFGRAVGTDPTELLPGFFAAGIDPEGSMREYAESALHSKRLTDFVFHPKVAAGFLRGIPGLAAWAFLGKSWYFADPRAHGPHHLRPSFDTVIVDAPATGDATEILKVPEIIRELSPRGRLREDADACRAMLADPSRSRVVVVSLPEELVTSETEELVGVVRRELGLPLGPIIVNRLSAPSFHPEEEQLLARNAAVYDRSARSGDPALTALALGSRRALADEQASRELVRLEALGLGTIRLPELPEEPIGLGGISALGRYLAEDGSERYRPGHP